MEEEIEEEEEESDLVEDEDIRRSEGSGGCAVTPGPCAPIPCVGHAAVVVQKGKKKIMLVIFGHSSRYGYLNTVQEYNLGK